MLWFHKAHDTRNLNALMDCRLLCLTHFVANLLPFCQAMFAWGNQSCGRLGLQEKKMEKALASAVRNAQGVLKIVCAKDCRVLFGKWLIEIWIHWTLHKERGGCVSVAYSGESCACLSFKGFRT